MRQNGLSGDSGDAIARYFSQSLPTQQETLGQIVTEILRSGKSLNRAAICAKLLRRLELSTSAEEERHYHELIGMLFGR